jgi:hypothetical protein
MGIMLLLLLTDAPSFASPARSYQIGCARPSAGNRNESVVKNKAVYGPGARLKTARNNTKYLQA